MAKRESISNSFTVNSVQDGARGKTGRFYYYAQEWYSGSTSYIVTDAQAPYFKYQGHYWVFNPPQNYPLGITMAAMGTPSSSNSNWEIMTDDFKYIITQAIFGSFAKFGSAVISGDWMLSTNGTINGTAYNNGAIYNGSEAYTWFDPSNPSNSVNGSHTNGDHTWTGYNFIPNYCVDLLTGVIYTNAAVLKTGCKVGRFDIVENNLHVGTDGDWNSASYSGNITLLSDGRMKLRHTTDNETFSQIAIGEKADSSSSIKAAVIKRKDSLNYQFYDPALEIGAFTSTNYQRVGLRVYQGLSVFGEGVMSYGSYNTVGSSGTFDIDISKGNCLLIENKTGSDKYVKLPSYSDLLSLRGQELPSIFVIPLTIVAHRGNTGNIKVTFGTSDYYFYDMSGNQWASSGVDMPKSSTLKLLLVYDTHEYYAQKVYFSQDIVDLYNQI